MVSGLWKRGVILTISHSVPKLIFYDHFVVVWLFTCPSSDPSPRVAELFVGGSLATSCSNSQTLLIARLAHQIMAGCRGQFLLGLALIRYCYNDPEKSRGHNKKRIAGFFLQQSLECGKMRCSTTVFYTARQGICVIDWNTEDSRIQGSWEKKNKEIYVHI
jgi:hypothetical protein